jgi:hypothetical protein
MLALMPCYRFGNIFRREVAVMVRLQDIAGDGCGVVGCRCNFRSGHSIPPMRSSAGSLRRRWSMGGRNSGGPCDGRPDPGALRPANREIGSVGPGGYARSSVDKISIEPRSRAGAGNGGRKPAAEPIGDDYRLRGWCGERRPSLQRTGKHARINGRIMLSVLESGLSGQTSSADRSAAGKEKATPS